MKEDDLMIRKGVFLVLIVCCVFQLSYAQANMDSTLKEANEKFTYHGKPIHPFLIGEFTGNLADDRPPMITTIDIAAAYDTNAYPQSEVKRQYEQWFVERTEGDEGYKTYESYGYNWLGKMNNNIQVVEIGENGGGSGTFMNLVFIKFTTGKVFDQDKNYGQLLMTVVSIYDLGDRYDGDIKIYPDKVFIPASKGQFGGGSVNKDVVLKYPFQ